MTQIAQAAQEMSVGARSVVATMTEITLAVEESSAAVEQLAALAAR